MGHSGLVKSSLWARVGLTYLAVGYFALGLWAAIAPKQYFEHFPGAGHAWVAIDGPYNEHLMRDYGALNLALAAVAVCAVIFMTRELILAAGIMTIVYTIPHVAYHIAHPSRIGDTSDQFGAIGGLLFNGVVGLLLVIYAVMLRSNRSRTVS